ncbi:MAG: tyrosine-protein phosphatase [Pseudonocardia sp.]
MTGLVNLRDVGRARPAAGNGAVVAPGRLFRSDSLHTATPDDLQHLFGERGVRALLDLRGPAEAARHPVAREADTGYVNVPLRQLAGELPDTDDVLGEMYVDYLRHDPNLPVAVGVLAGLLARGPAVVFCSAGKDRTGMVVALTLGLAGVPTASIVGDYVDTAPNLPAVLRKIESTPADGTARRLPLGLRDCPPSAMERFLRTVDRDHGSFPGWARRVGIPQGTDVRLRELLTTVGAA